MPFTPGNSKITVPVQEGDIGVLNREIAYNVSLAPVEKVAATSGAATGLATTAASDATGFSTLTWVLIIVAAICALVGLWLIFKS